MIGARDMAFPRLNALSYWVFLGVGALHVLQPRCIGSAPDDGWFNYAPLSLGVAPGTNIDFYGLGLIFLGISSTAGAVNFIVTIFSCARRACRSTGCRCSAGRFSRPRSSIVFAVPVADRGLPPARAVSASGASTSSTPPHGGDALLWQHLFWIFGHPDVYIIFLPAVGIVSTIIPVFSRRPMVGYHLSRSRRWRPGCSASASGCTTCSPSGCRSSR